MKKRGPPLNQLDTVSIAFVVPPVPDVPLESLALLDVHRDWRNLSRGPYSWCLQTYLELRDRGYPVVLANEPVTGFINVVHVRQLFRFERQSDQFFVSIQADCPDVVPWAPVNVVQNKHQEDRRRSYWIPHWPQPGLIPRSPARNRVECAAYAGTRDWLAGTLYQWRRDLDSLGIEFRYLGEDRWNDYSEVDVLIAVRSFDHATYDGKPPTKVLNAWHARVPLIAGYDSAYSQIARPGHDYLQVASSQEAIGAVRSLRDDPTRYRSIVEAGAASGQLYTRDRIALKWIELLEGPIRTSYLRWKKR